MAKSRGRKMTSVLGRVSYFTVLAKSYPVVCSVPVQDDA